MTRISIGAADVEWEPYEVDLWGTTFLAKPATRSVAKAADDLIARLQAVTDTDEAAAIYGEALDLRLSPAGNGRTKASTLVKRKWEADAVTLARLEQLLNDIGAADRPT